MWECGKPGAAAGRAENPSRENPSPAVVRAQEGVSTDIQYLEQADTVVQAILEALPNNGPAWALLSLIYADKASGISPFSEEEGDPEVAAADARNARYKAMQLCQAAQAQGIEGIGANFYMQVIIRGHPRHRRYSPSLILLDAQVRGALPRLT